jgi:membrane protein DedA with SNARE-associated domain
MTPSDGLAALGYPTLFFVGILGNMGVPVPEKSMLLVAGYLVWAGELHALLVVGLGVAGALIGANLAYWLGRRLGRPAVERCAARLRIAPGRIEAAASLLARYGCLGVFVSRFVPGVRFLANTLAGVSALRPVPFSVACGCAALAYLPVLVGAGYLAALRFGERLGTAGGPFAPTHALLPLLFLLPAGLLAAGLRLRRART